MKIFLSSILLFFLSCEANAQLTIFPKGAYKSLAELKEKKPSLQGDFELIRRDDSKLKVNGYIDYKVKSEFIGRSVINKEIYAISTGDTLYLNCTLQRIRFDYARVLVEGRYFAFDGGEALTDIDAASSYITVAYFGGLVGALLVYSLDGQRSTATNKSYLYALDTFDGSLNVLNSNYLEKLLEPFADLQAQYSVLYLKYDREVLLRYLTLLNLEY